MTATSMVAAINGGSVIKINMGRTFVLVVTIVITQILTVISPKIDLRDLHFISRDLQAKSKSTTMDVVPTMQTFVANKAAIAVPPTDTSHHIKQRITMATETKCQ